MAGRKNQAQQLGMRPDISHIEDPFLRDMAFRGAQLTPFCKHCGQVIVESGQDDNGFNVDSEWEIKNRTHYKCMKKHEAYVQTELSIARAKEEKRRAEEAENFDWDAYMKDMLNRKE
jgi:hypothetical protein